MKKDIEFETLKKDLKERMDKNTLLRISDCA